MPSIKEKPQKSKCLEHYLGNVWLFAGVSLLLVAAILFGSVRLATLFKAKNTFEIRVAEAAFPTNLSGKEGSFVGAKSGKSYYFPWCGTVNRIKDANLVWFADRASAEALGYVPAGNCHGLK